MGKQGSPRRPRPGVQNADLALGMKDYQFRYPETLPGSDPSIGRRMSWGENHWNPKTVLLHGLKNDSAKYSAFKGVYIGKRHLWLRKYVRSIAFMFGLMGFVLLIDSLMVSIFDVRNLQPPSTQIKSSGQVNVS